MLKCFPDKPAASRKESGLTDIKQILLRLETWVETAPFVAVEGSQVEKFNCEESSVKEYFLKLTVYCKVTLISFAFS